MLRRRPRISWQHSEYSAVEPDSIFDKCEIRNVDSTRRCCEDVMKNRNAFAHRWGGIDWKTQEMSLWNSGKRTWEPIPDGQERQYREMCKEAIDAITVVCHAITQVQQESKEV